MSWEAEKEAGAEDIGVRPPSGQSVPRGCVCVGGARGGAALWWSENGPPEVFRVDSSWQRSVTGSCVAFGAGKSLYHQGLYRTIILQEAGEPLEAPWYLLTMIQFLKMLHLRVFLKPLVGREFSQVTESSSGQGHIFCTSISTESSMTAWINAVLVQGQTNKCSAEDLRQ